MSLKDNLRVVDEAAAGLTMGHSAQDSIEVKGSFKVICRAADGSVRWEDELSNLVVTVGKNDLFNKYFGGSAYNAAFFVGLKTAGSISAADTMSSKSWTEITVYSNGTRPAYTAGTAVAGSTDNTASPAVFNINGTATVGGCFIVTGAGANTIGGTTGTLFSATDFAVARSVLSGDTLTVTYTISC
jgi:hypothetical protein